ncbi:hypothetical protein RRG08_067382 [Elysia crispata]|uniref:Uncharacterized protein n=1 Tax=Elysia crispata TaxID=231223 RepID=A0AAE0Y904_9GAST|nr:hypothetical protein RRG08_067382 [Elysia crispata]
MARLAGDSAVSTQPRAQGRRRKVKVASRSKRRRQNGVPGSPLLFTEIRMESQDHPCSSLRSEWSIGSPLLFTEIRMESQDHPCSSLRSEWSPRITLALH